MCMVICLSPSYFSRIDESLKKNQTNKQTKKKQKAHRKISGKCFKIMF